MSNDNIREAYRKLKGTVYYDKTLAYIRTRIAEYEDKEIDSKLNELAKALGNDNRWNVVEERILKSISVLTFPKSIRYLEERDKDAPIVVSNVQANRTYVEKYNNFIDMSVEGFLVGILWVINIGYAIDKSLSESCYGNRLRENLVLKEGDVTASPNLFRPYFDQYETWRNNGLDKAKDYINNFGQNIVITMLDLSRYYYNVDFTQDDFYELTRNKDLDNKQKRINNTVFKIIETYSKKCGVEHIILPIGFQPSNILANAYLVHLDAKISGIPGTVYYGRYVDDIMWVQSAENYVSLVDLIHNEGSQVIASTVINDLIKRGIIANNSEKYAISGEKYLEVEQSKFRFFFLDKDGSKDLIENIKKDIQSNTSEFNFIPEEYAGDYNSNLFKLERDDTVNKVRGITGAVLDKYALSKSIGKSVLMSAFTEDTQVDGFIDCIEQILDSKEIISNYLLWESILNYYIVNRRVLRIIDFTASVMNALEMLDEDSYKKDKYKYLSDNKEDIRGVKESLVYHYWSCLGRSLAIVWGEEIPAVLREITDIINTSVIQEKYSHSVLKALRKRYILSRMNNKSVLPVTSKHILKVYGFMDTGETTYISDLQEYLGDNKEKKVPNDYNYLPYIDTPFDIGFTFLIEQLHEGNGHLCESVDYVKYVMSEYQSNFPGMKKDALSSVIKIISDDNIAVKSEKKTDIRTAVANVRMCGNDIEDILDGKKANKSGRAKEIAELTNEAIKNKADVLVMPEAYVPLQYISLLAKKSAKRQMMTICGIEHIVANGNVWNLTCILIPFIVNDVKYVIPFFRQKKYFAPHEENSIASRGLKIGPTTQNTLFKWGGYAFAAYCCYELTAVHDRAEFIGKAETIYAIEWNQDVNYYSNIMESLSRDMYCYCVQANMSEYGDSRIVAPAHSYCKDIMRVKGGENATILIGIVDIEKLRESKKNADKRKKNNYAALPAGI